MSKIPLHLHEVNTAFEYLLEEYLNDNSDIGETLTQINFDSNNIESEFDAKEEEEAVAAFLKNPCPCSRNCQKQLSYQEVIKNRAFFRTLGKKERNNILLIILKSQRYNEEFSFGR